MIESEKTGDALSASGGRISTQLWNKDLAPIPRDRRTWGTYNYAALWVAMSVNIPTYMLASAMIAGGMNWKQALVTVFLGNVIVLIPMLLNAHAGAQYGIPFPVFARSSFGVLGANVPAILRALVACGWFGIQTWIGGEAINTLLAAVRPGWDHPWLCFFLFWLLNLAVILRGIETIRYLQGVTAPALLVLGLAMLGWAYVLGIFCIFCAVAHGRRGLLGYRRAEHSGFHPLRERTTGTDAGASAGLADDDDFLFFHRHCGHFGYGRGVRRGGLGSGGGAQQTGQSDRGGRRHAGLVARDAERECRGQRGFAGE
jgi:hypothetical protein